MSDAVLLIESAARGGGMITASLAQSYSREVMALPGRITDRYSEGCNALIDRKHIPKTSKKSLTAVTTSNGIFY